MQPKVSIITPCYNGEYKVTRFLDSLLDQTYSNIELIIINDGSTDNTEEVIFSYKDKLIDKGIQFVYLKQNNFGQDVALNNGLKYFTGDYLMWPDSDDIFGNNQIKKMVSFLENNRCYGMVHCNALLVNEKDNDIVEKKWNRTFSEDIYKNFLDILLWKNVTASGVWMLRSSALLEVRPNREIEIIRQGQNWQMLLPMAYNYKIGKCDDFLFKIVLYNNSHSRIQKSYEKQKQRIVELGEGRILILKNMTIPKERLEYCSELVRNDMNKKLFSLACDNDDYEDACWYWQKLVDKKFRDKLKLYLVKQKIYGFIKKLNVSKMIK